MSTANTASDRIDQIMDQVQVFASSWSLVGGPYDCGGEREHAENCRAKLLELVAALALLPGPRATPEKPPTQHTDAEHAAWLAIDRTYAKESGALFREADRRALQQQINEGGVA